MQSKLGELMDAVDSRITDTPASVGAGQAREIESMADCKHGMPYGNCCYLIEFPGERGAVQAAIALADVFGYGHLISSLQAAWVEKLITEHGIDEESARAATMMTPYPRKCASRCKCGHNCSLAFNHTGKHEYRRKDGSPH